MAKRDAGRQGGAAYRLAAGSGPRLVCGILFKPHEVILVPQAELEAPLESGHGATVGEFLAGCGYVEPAEAGDG